MVDSTKTAPKTREDKKGPSKEVLQFILGYSKSTEAKKIKNEAFLFHLN